MWQRPTVDTKFHIDMDWWENSERDIRVFMADLLCDKCRADFGDNLREVDEIDWVDEETGEVTRVDGLWHMLRICCANEPDFISPSTPVIDAVFRTFLANGNKPLSIVELYERLDRRPPKTLLRILTAGRTYMGIRPARED
jgi:hypothetical protein